MPLASIIPITNRVPGIYMRVSLGVGLRNALDASRKLAVFGNKTAAGTAVEGRSYRVTGEDNARVLFGAGSELFLMCKAAFDANPSADVVGFVIASSAGTAATGTLVFSGTATLGGTCVVWVRGERIEVPVLAGASASSVANDVATAIEAMGDWPVTVGVASETVTATARHAGPRGNQIALRCELVDVVGLTVTPPASGFLTSGATADNPANAITAARAERGLYYYAVPYVDDTALAAFSAMLEALDEPEIGKRGVMIAGCVSVASNPFSLATSLNFARAQLVWVEGSEDYPGVIAAAFAATRQRYDGSTPAANIAGVAVPGLRPSPRLADQPDAAALAVVSLGVTPLRPVSGGAMAVVRSVTTRTLDANGSADYRVLDAHKASVADFVASDLEVFLADRFAQFYLTDDDPDGELPPNGVATPATIKDAIFGRLTTYDAGNPRAALILLERTEQNVESLIVERAPAPDGRVNASIPIDVIDHLLQIGADVRQVG